MVGLLKAPDTELVEFNASYLSFSWTPPFSPDSHPKMLDFLKFFSEYVCIEIQDILGL